MAVQKKCQLTDDCANETTWFIAAQKKHHVIYGYSKERSTNLWLYQRNIWFMVVWKKT